MFLEYLFLGFVSSVIGQSDNVVNHTYTGTATSSLVQCDNYTAVEQCRNIMVLPWGVVGLDALDNTKDSSNYTMFAVQNVLFENDQNFTTALCNHKDDSDGGLCTFSAVENCTSRFPFFLQNQFPTPSRMQQLRKIICGHRQDYNAACVRSKIQELVSCVNVSDMVYNAVNAIKVVNETTVALYEQLMQNATCTTYELARVCAPRVLKECGEDTVRMYLQVIPDYPECYTAPVQIDNVVNHVYTTTASLSIAQCDNYTAVEQCPNMMLLPWGFVGLDAFPNTEDSTNYTMFAVQNVLFENDHNFTTALCNHQDDSDGGLCTFSAVENCTSRFPFFFQNQFPTPSRMQQLRKIICGHRQNFNAACVRSKIHELVSCVNISGMVYNAVNDTPVALYEQLMQNATCMTYALGRVCAPRVLKECGEETVRMYVQVIPDYPECQTAPEISLPKVDCSDAVNSARACFYNTKLYNSLFDQSSIEEMMDYVLQSVTLDTDNQDVCRNLDSYVEALNCSINVRRQCVDDAMKPSVQDPQRVTHGLVQLCRNMHKFDSPCVKTSTKNACTTRKRSSIYEQIILKHLCGEVTSKNQCLLSAVKPCGQTTSGLYKNILRSQLPEMCFTQGHVPVVG